MSIAGHKADTRLDSRFVSALVKTARFLVTWHRLNRLASAQDAKPICWLKSACCTWLPHFSKSPDEHILEDIRQE